MASVVRLVSSGVQRIASLVLGLLPGPPSDDALPPDVDGRRPTDADLTRIRVDIERKNGKGGYR
jgi:hypothetical protein